MVQHDRHASRAAATVARFGHSSAGEGFALRKAVASAREFDDFGGVLAADRQRLLTVAQDQGLLPPETSPIAPPTSAEQFHAFLHRARTIPSDITPSRFVEPIEPIDGLLDGPQRDAVARALQTPDLLLIQGLPSTGKSRVVAEIIRQAAVGGKRVLFLAQSASAIDRVLSQIRDATALVAVRCLGREERVEQLSPDAMALRGSVREESFRSESLRQAIAREREAMRRRDAVRDLAPVWASLLELFERLRQRDHDRDAIRQQREGLLSDVRRDADAALSDSEFNPLIVGIHQAAQNHRQCLARSDMERADFQKARIPFDAELQLAKAHRDGLKAQENAGRSWRFWSPSCWKAKFNKSLPEQVVEAEAKLADLEEASRQLAEKENHLRQERERVDADFAAERLRLIDLEIGRRAEELDGRVATLLPLDSADNEKLAHLLSKLPAGDEVSRSPTLDGVRAASENAANELRIYAGKLAFLQDWRQFIEREPGPILERWRAGVNLVAGPISSFGSDPWLVQAAAATALFDLLIVDEAHLIAEDDLWTAAKRSKRWVFLGEPVQTPPANARTVPPRNNGPRQTRPISHFFAQLWSRLHHETWIREDGRHCCRLHPVDPAKRRELEIEWVADRPDIELRILNSESSEPVLAEVLFPASMSIAEAKEFLFREIGEIPCQSRNRTARWISGPDCLIFRLSPLRGEPLPTSSIVLGDGIILRMPEHSKDHGPCEVEFVFSELGGWDRSSAEAWVDKHLLMRDSGRTCGLETNHRQTPALAAWLNDAVAVGYRYSTDHRSDGAIQFEPVPRRTPTGQRRGGAGLEIDLSDPAQREFLPLELADSLPTRGIVNLPEAQAIADLLPRLASGHTIVVAAPYSAQVEVLKHYCKGRVPVLTPVELEQREVDLVVVSLTRSHLTRAVTFGDDPATILRIFSRPRCRLVIVGDPGTLTRRAQWEGAIDHLDETSGERERRWVNALLRFLPARPQSSRALQGVKA